MNKIKFIKCLIMILKNKFIEINKDVKFNEKNFGLKINTT
jgi:hypothetical protein